MCGICGCSEEPVLDHHHHEVKFLGIEQDILAQNNHLASHNNQYFKQKNILALNIMSSPGSGKTTLLAKTISDLRQEINIAVIVGDQHTDLDAKLIQASGGRALQVNTGQSCHLDAHSVGHALEQVTMTDNMILFIENIGNLVCPALFNLGESYKIVILSVTEGDNKPLKYQEMFRCADLMILTKTDLLPYVDFDVDKCCEYARRINPTMDIVSLSATKNVGLSSWYDWLLQKRLSL